MNQSKTIDSQQSLVEVMLEFVRAAVLDRNPVISQHIVIDWDNLMDIAVEQELVALVWDGICKLPKESQPPRQQRINWGLSAQSIWDDYKKKKDILSSLIEVCDQNNIRLLLLKGNGLSMLYPNPQSRMSGDIDIFLFEDFQKGNILFTGKRIHERSKHSTFIIDGVSIENHRNFLEPNTAQKRKIIKYIRSTLKDVQKTQDGYYILSPLANLVFLTFHTLKHFHGGKQIPIRNIIDFYLFLKHNREDLPPERCRDVLSQIDLVGSFSFLVCLSELILKNNISDYHLSEIPVPQIVELKALLYSNLKMNVPLDNCMSYYLPTNHGITFKNIIPVLGNKLFRTLFHVPNDIPIMEYLKHRF